MKKTRIRFEQHKLTLITGLLILASCISGGVQLSSCTADSHTAYYIDPVAGNDANSGDRPTRLGKA